MSFSQAEASERQLQVMLDAFAVLREPSPVDEADADVASARRVTRALRREQAARDGRPLAHLWDGIAGRVDRLYPEQ